MHKTILTEEESCLLHEYQEKSPIALTRLRCQVLLMHVNGVPTKTLGVIVNRDIRTVQRWLKEFTKKRISSIFSFKIDNENASKLTRMQKLEIANVLKEPITERSAIPKRFWDVPELRNYVKARFDVIYESKQSYHFLLKFSDLRFKYPEKEDRHRDEELIRARMVEIKSELREILTNNEWEVFCADETRLEERSITRRAWVKKGEKTMIKISRDHEIQSYIGFLDQRSFKCSLFGIDTGNQKEMIRTIQELRQNHPRKKLCIIWDNARFHKGKEIRRELRTGGKLEDVYFINLPPYAPENNPIEHVWNVAKGEIFKLRIHDGFAELREKFESFIKASSFNYEL